MIIPNLRFKRYLIVFYCGHLRVHSVMTTALTGDIAASNAKKEVPKSLFYTRLNIIPQW